MSTDGNDLLRLSEAVYWAFHRKEPFKRLSEDVKGGLDVAEPDVVFNSHSGRCGHNINRIRE